MSLNSFSEALDGAPRDALVSPQHLDLRLKPATDTSPVAIVIPTMKLTAIPGAMRKMGWDVAASLMDRWFASPAWEMPSYWKGNGSQLPGNIAPDRATQIPAAQVDNRIVKMDWAMTFPRCQAACRHLLEKVTNPAAVNRLRRVLKDARWDGVSRFSLGRVDYDAREIEENCQVNMVTLGAMGDTLDDMYGALGVATAKIGVVGEAMLDTITGRQIFTVQKVGIYIRDYYDFNGFQFLGTWTESGVLSKGQMLANAFMDAQVYAWQGDGIGTVFNSDFAEYRKRYGRGGDFVIYSDVLWISYSYAIDLGYPT